MAESKKANHDNKAILFKFIAESSVSVEKVWKFGQFHMEFFISSILVVSILQEEIFTAIVP